MAAAERWYRRHAALVRITHWINVVCFTLLLMSGLQIFNAHPALYVGERSDFDHPTISIRAHLSENGLVGETAIVGHSFDTTGVLGVSSENGQVSSRAFRAGSLSQAPRISRLDALAFLLRLAMVLNALIYLVWGIASRHFGRAAWSLAISGGRSANICACASREASGEAVQCTAAVRLSHGRLRYCFRS